MMSLLQSIGDYQILEKLGRGGMADVYLAVEQKTGRRVALKLVERGEGTEAQEIVEAERLGAELQQQMSLADPRVPQIHAFGDLERFFFIEMEFVEGRDLSALIGSGALKPESAAGIALELCSILRTAHGMSLHVDGRELRAIVHGDIKPKNIRIDNTGTVRVLDFGIAKGLSITRRLTSNVFGSVAYSSPERLETGNIDEMSDLWAVGIVLYEMVEARLPFEAASTERLETIIRSRSPLRSLNESCPAALQEIVYKALSRSSANRYSSAAQFQSDLEAFLSGTPTLASQENEQTRRTVAAPDDTETTRTVPTVEPLLEIPPSPLPSPAAVSFPAAAPESRASSISRKLKQRIFRSRKWIIAGCAGILALMGIWEGIAMRAAARLKPDFVQSRLDAESAWSKYQEIEKKSLLGIAPITLRAPLRDVLTGYCERVVDEYRNSDAPRVKEGDWIRCRRHMSRVVRLYANDKRSEAMYEYANGHILRINRRNMDAIAAFQRAASLDKKWPDPYLGMARTYIYNLGDMERGTQALERAQQLGHSFGKRELAMMADAQKKQGLQDLENAVSMRGTDQEKEFLKRAKSELENALSSYTQIAPWGDSTTQILTIQDTLGQIRNRLDELDAPNPLLPWNWFK